MAVINTGLLTRDARSEFFNRFNSADQLALYNELCTRIASTKDSESYRWLGTVPQVREWGTGRKAKGLRTERYDVENLKYEATLEVDRDEISDDQTGQIRVRVNELAQRAATHKDYLIAQLLINGATAGFNSYDGVTYFSTAHVSGASGSQDNALTPAAVDANNPTVAEFKTALTAAIETMLAYKDDQGEPMMINQAALMCLVPTTMLFTAMEAVNATVISATTNVIAGIATVKAFPWLSTASTWYLAKTDGIVRPMVFQDREPIEFKALETGSDEEFLREKYLYGVRARYRMTYGYWQYMLRNVFTQS